MSIFCPTLLEQWAQIQGATLRMLLAYKKLKDAVAKQNMDLN